MTFIRSVATFILFTFFAWGMVSCGHLPSDIHPNPASSGYHRMEFDISYSGNPVKEIGIGNIFLTEDQDLGNISFKFYGLYKGTLYMKSNACGINVSIPFEGSRTFYLRDLIPYPMKCSIDLVAETSQINNKEHNIVETGKIKINVIPSSYKPLVFEYVRTNSMKVFYKKYSWFGQGSIQRQEGDLTTQEEFTVKTGLDGGGIYRVAGCTDSQVYEGAFSKGDFRVRLIDIYNKKFLNREDTCDLEVIVIPNDIPESLVGRFSVSIFDKNAVPLENLSFGIKKSFGGYKLEVSGQKYILACSISNTYSLKNECSTQYYKDTVYWVRAITTNGRKSIFAVKNGEVFWAE